MSTTSWPSMSSELQLTVVIQLILNFEIFINYWRNQCKPSYIRIFTIFCINFIHAPAVTREWGVGDRPCAFIFTIRNVWTSLCAKMKGNGWLLRLLRNGFRPTVSDQKWSFLVSTLSKFIIWGSRLSSVARSPYENQRIAEDSAILIWESTVSMNGILSRMVYNVLFMPRFECRPFQS